jgi:hypothetical protein
LGFISQSISTVIGQTYTLKYFLWNNGGTPNVFQATVDGTSLNALVDINAQPYTQYVHNFVATATSTLLQFGFQQNPSYFNFDDVSVTSASAVPEPFTVLGSMVALGAGAAIKRKNAKKAVKS